MRYSYAIWLLAFIFCSCQDSDKRLIKRTVAEWEGREIRFPENMVFTMFGSDTVEYQASKANYAIVVYTDSVGCTSCKMKFQRWAEIMIEVNSVVRTPIPFVFIFHPKDEKDLADISRQMKRDDFDYPVCIDTEDAFNKINGLPSESIFHTVLVDKDNKVVAMGDPFQNPQIKDLYLKIIGGYYPAGFSSSDQTEVYFDETVFDLGEFYWKIPQKAIFVLINEGEKHLVINDVVSSCRCMSVEFTKMPLAPGASTVIGVIYRSDKPEHFNKTLTVYANIPKPIKLRVEGEAKRFPY